MITTSEIDDPKDMIGSQIICFAPVLWIGGGPLKINGKQCYATIIKEQEKILSFPALEVFPIGTIKGIDFDGTFSDINLHALTEGVEYGLEWDYFTPIIKSILIEN